MNKGAINIKINWKARFKNKTFLISFIALILSFTYKSLAIFEIIPRVTESEVFDSISVLVNFLGLMGVVVDPTTKGISDSERALTYYNNEIYLKGENNE
ncbi:MAG: phage holin [Clostridia bacterium]|nr:phage holin [Clostridia bacterium]